MTQGRATEARSLTTSASAVMRTSAPSATSSLLLQHTLFNEPFATFSSQATRRCGPYEHGLDGFVRRAVTGPRPLFRGQAIRRRRLERSFISLNAHLAGPGRAYQLHLAAPLPTRSS
jgi:hypothetical protein